MKLPRLLRHAVVRRAAPYVYFPAASAMIGAVAWAGHIAGLLAAPLCIVLWARSKTRLQAFSTAMAYYLAAGHGLVKGAGVFFGDTGILPAPIPGILLWTGYSALLSAAWGMMWGGNHRAVRLLLALVLVSIPPLGVVGGFNPILAAGAYFPGLGWGGLLLTILGFCLLTCSRISPLAALPFIAIAVASNAVYDEPVAVGWSALDTSFGPAASPNSQFARLATLQRYVTSWSTSAPAKSVLVLPELVGEDWSINGSWWHRLDSKLKAQQQTVLLGAYLPRGNGEMYENVIVSLGHASGPAMRGRVPVPISMWKPWANTGAIAYWDESGVNEVAGKRVATLVCYEQLLVWPVLLSLLDKPDLLIGPANDWWAKDTNLPELQQQSVKAWARAFSVPSIWTTNR
jgi:hypothetical protein